MADELTWRLITKRCVRTTLIAFTTASFNQMFDPLRIEVQVGIKTLVSQGSVEALNELIDSRLV